MSQKPGRNRLLAPASNNEQAKELLARSRDPGRVLTLTDGVFAIIMTLLVLNIHVPQLTRGEDLALRLYGLLFVLISLMRLWLWYYIGTRPVLLLEQVDRRTLWTGAAAAIVPAVLYLVAMLLAGFVPYVSFGIYAVLPLLYFIGITLLRRSAPKGSPESDFT